MQPLQFPMTIYAVALLYVGPSRGTTLCSRMLTVSGVNPLTAEEVSARARKAVEETWNAEKFGPFDEQTFSSFAYESYSITAAQPGVSDADHRNCPRARRGR
jgi:hypothetical protein